MKNQKPTLPVFEFISERPFLSVNRIAEQIGISQATLSLAKDGKRQVSKDIEDKVVEALKPYGYADWLYSQIKNGLLEKGAG